MAHSIRMHDAIIADNITVVGRMVEMGRHHEPNDNLDTPLHCAAAYGRDTIVKLLLRSGSSIRTFNRIGLTPIACAIVHGRASTLELILSLEDSNFEWTQDWSTLIDTLVCFVKNAETIITILQAVGVNVHSVAMDKWRVSMDTIISIRRRIYFQPTLLSLLMFWL